MLKENEEYRNKEDFQTPDNNMIDAGTLWKKKGNKLILDDDDFYHETDFDLELFEPIE